MGGSEAERSVVDVGIVDLLSSVVPDARCVDAVTLVDDLRPGGDVVGDYNRSTHEVRIDRSVATRAVDFEGEPVWGDEALRLVAAHEACHGVDVGLDLHSAHRDLFRAEDGSSPNELAESVVAWCERGMSSLDFARAALEACGDDDAVRADSVLVAAADRVAWGELDVDVGEQGSWSPPVGERIAAFAAVGMLSPEYVTVTVTDAAGDVVEQRRLDLRSGTEGGPFEPTGPRPERPSDEEMAGRIPADWALRSAARLGDTLLVVGSRPIPPGRDLQGMFAVGDDGPAAGPCLRTDAWNVLVPSTATSAWWLELEAEGVSWRRLVAR